MVHIQAISETKIEIKHLIIGFSTKWLSFLRFLHKILHFGIKKKLKIEWNI